MKKTNNRYRNNNNNNYSAIYSLNYKFDSCSPAGKTSGTALDLIKRYNELAKEALSNSDYINGEVYRQYAEHYRKIVTDINEKKNQNNARYNNQKQDSNQNQNVSPVENTEAPAAQAQVIDINNDNNTENNVLTEKKSFTVIEIKPESAKTELIEPKAETKPTTRRAPRKKAVAV